MKILQLKNDVILRQPGGRYPTNHTQLPNMSHHASPSWVRGLRNDDFLLRNDEFLLKHDDFLLKNVAFIMKMQVRDTPLIFDIEFDPSETLPVVDPPTALLSDLAELKVNVFIKHDEFCIQDVGFKMMNFAFQMMVLHFK